MLTLSYRTLGALVAGAVIAGWLSASVVTPPRAASQALPGRRTPPAATLEAIPALALDMAARPTPRPAGGRNPFAFGGARTGEAVTARASGPDETVDGEEATRPAPPVAPQPRWALVGMATDGDGLTAVLSGVSGVHLVKAGDRLPDGAEIVDLAGDRVTLRGIDGETRVLRLP